MNFTNGTRLPYTRQNGTRNAEATARRSVAVEAAKAAKRGSGPDGVAVTVGEWPAENGEEKKLLE